MIRIRLWVKTRQLTKIDADTWVTLRNGKFNNYQ